MTAQNALDLFPSENAEAGQPRAAEITRARTASSSSRASAPLPSTAAPPTAPVARPAPRHPNLQTPANPVPPLQPPKARRFGLTAAPHSGFTALCKLNRLSTRALAKGVGLAHRAAAEVRRCTLEDFAPALSRGYAAGVRAWNRCAAAVLDGAGWSRRVALQASTDLWHLVAGRAWPACRRAAGPVLASLQKLAREPEVADHHTPALEPSRLALLSSTTLTIAFIAISMDGGLGRANAPVEQPAEAALPAGVAFSPSVASLDAGPVTSEEPVRAAAAPSIASEPPQVPQSALYRRMRSVNPVSAVQEVLNQYRDGVSTLDPAAVKALWPGVDELAMNTYFKSLFDHNLQFDACRISVSGSSATAICRGSTSSIFNARTRRRFTEAREWKFTLAEEGGRWLITSVVSGEPGGVETRTF